MKKQLKLSDLKLGMTVVPHSKTVGDWGSLEESIVWKTALKRNQPFLYVVSIGDADEGDEVIVLDHDPGTNNGDYFSVNDFTLYTASYVCIKAFPGVKVGDKFEASSKPVEFFDPEYFDFEYEFVIPEVKICGYDVTFEGSNINWGCRSFTIEEIKTVQAAVEVIEGKELQFRLGYDSKSDQVNANDLENIIKFYKFKNK